MTAPPVRVETLSDADRAEVESRRPGPNDIPLFEMETTK